MAEALALVEQTDERLYEAELHRLDGELRLRDDKQAVEQLFDRALAVARQQGAKALELRAAMSLAALDPQRSGRPETRAILAQTLEGFTEGFDTLDIRQAAQILKTSDATNKWRSWSAPRRGPDPWP